VKRRRQLPTMPIPVIVMLPPHGGSTAAERWMAQVRLAAAKDLITRLQTVPQVGDILILAADMADRDALQPFSVNLLEPEKEPFHFGRVLARIGRQAKGSMAYFGGASAPLLTKDILTTQFARLETWDGRRALVNNLHSSDWLYISEAHQLETIAQHLPNDNALGWVLQTQAAYQVEAAEPSAASQCDIDTPADVCAAAMHPGAGEHILQFVTENPVSLMERLSAVMVQMQTPASSLGLIGRTSSTAWAALVKATRSWVRVYAEERGMTASGRQERGEVRSLLASAMDAMGEEAFIQAVESMMDAVLWDTRVWLAHHRIWPPDADRFAADLGLLDEIQDEALKRLTEAQWKATIPIVSGGHGIVGGSLLALVEAIDYQPSR